jgi:Holliday junction resolvasome RuvABC endonuclease subunit
VLAVDDNVRRARELVVGLRDVMRHFDVRAIAAESMSHPRNSSAAAKVALAWGVIVTLSEVAELPLLQASPQEVKHRVCQSKSASKDEVAFEVRRQLGNHIEDLLGDYPDGLHEHAYDAAATALACMSSDVVRALRRAA